MTRINKLRLYLAVVVLIILGVVLYIGRLRSEKKQLELLVEQMKQDPQYMVKEEVKGLVSVVSKIAALPTDEEPVLATVTDKEKLKDQPVFAKAENGDKILIYPKAQKAFVYRPSTGLLIDVVPVNMGNQPVTISGVDEKNPLTVALINGSKNVGVTAELEKRLLEKKIPGLKVVLRATAKSSGYDKTLVIDVNGKHGQQAKELALLVGGEVATQSAETLASADVMVILGSQFR